MSHKFPRSESQAGLTRRRFSSMWYGLKSPGGICRRVGRSVGSKWLADISDILAGAQLELSTRAPPGSLAIMVVLG